jgi:hypothetical protein
MSFLHVSAKPRHIQDEDSDTIACNTPPSHKQQVTCSVIAGAFFLPICTIPCSVVCSYKGTHPCSPRKHLQQPKLPFMFEVLLFFARLSLCGVGHSHVEKLEEMFQSQRVSRFKYQDQRNRTADVSTNF